MNRTSTAVMAPGLWSMEQLLGITLEAPVTIPPFEKVAIAVDPPSRWIEEELTVPIVVVGKEGGKLTVLADLTRTMHELSEVERTVVSATSKFTDATVAVDAMAYNMMKIILRHADPRIPVARVHVTRGIWPRAEKLASLYAEGSISHQQRFPELEEEMCLLRPDGRLEGFSRYPARIDALAIAVEYLTRPPIPSIRAI